MPNVDRSFQGSSVKTEGCNYQFLSRKAFSKIGWAKWDIHLIEIYGFFMATTFLLVGGVLTCFEAQAWEIRTHGQLTEEAINGVNNPQLNTYLLENLAVDLDENFGEFSGKEWIVLGSAEEDQLSVPPRVFQHFHDPLRPIPFAGLMPVFGNSAITEQAGK